MGPPPAPLTVGQHCVSARVIAIIIVRVETRRSDRNRTGSGACPRVTENCRVRYFARAARIVLCRRARAYCAPKIRDTAGTGPADRPHCPLVRARVNVIIYPTARTMRPPPPSHGHLKRPRNPISPIAGRSFHCYSFGPRRSRFDVIT